MISIITAIVLVIFTLVVVKTSWPEFHQNPYLFTEYDEEAALILVVQKVSKIVMMVLSVVMLALAAWMVYNGVSK